MRKQSTDKIYQKEAQGQHAVLNNYLHISI